MLKGLAFALSACFIWGFIFIVPQLTKDFNALEVALGRHFVYGLFSCFFLLKISPKTLFAYPKIVWIKAFAFSLVTSLGYYTCVLLAIRCATPTICALILGISPIAIAFYGNIKQKEIRFRILLLPSICIVLGLSIINFPNFEKCSSASSYLLGLAYSFIALFAWSWYAVSNSRFLKKHPYINPNVWSTLMGVTTLIWGCCLLSLILFFAPSQIQFEKYLTFNLPLARFILGTLFLGFLCSWVGTSLWSRASIYLPVSFTGQISVCETIFGITFVYIFNHNTPTTLETIGIMLFLAAIVYGIREFTRQPIFRNNKNLGP